MNWILNNADLIAFNLVFGFGLLLFVIASREAIEVDNQDEVRRKSHGLRLIAGSIMLLSFVFLIRFFWMG